MENHADQENLSPTAQATDETKKSSNKMLVALIVLYALAVGIALVQLLSRKSAEPKSTIGLPGALQIQKFKSGGPSIAIVPIYGVITVAEQGQMFRPMSSDRITKRLKSLAEQEDVKAVVLRINSPGGSVGAVQEIYDEVLRLKKNGKKVVVSMGDVAASGGYYVAAAADKIFADPGTLTGSIGVIFEVGNVQELFKKIGLKVEAIKSAEHKDIASPFRTMTEKERKIIQSLINDSYSQFVDAIVQGRKMKKENVLALADGRIFSGTQAKSEGLIDALGNLEAAIAKAAEMAEIKEKPRLIYEEDPWEKVFSILAEGSKENFWQKPLSKFGVRFAYLWEYAL